MASKSVQSTPQPGQIVIETSDYDNALTALITQQVTVNVAGTGHSVSANTILNWLAVNKAGQLTYIKVKTNQVVNYLTKLASTNSGINTNQINAAAKQISNQLLNANGLTVNL